VQNFLRGHYEPEEEPRHMAARSPMKTKPRPRSNP